MMSESPIPTSGSGWTRGRVIFLAVSAVGVVAIVFFTREILLPFLLAIITAYVLMPAVELCERAKIPRGLAIIVVYAITFGALYASVAAIAPRMVEETQSFIREAPGTARRMAAQWTPMVERKARDLLREVGDPPPEPAQSAPAFQIIKDGEDSYSVRMAGGVDVVQEGPKVWRVRQVKHRSETFSIAALVSEGLLEAAGYARRNALELLSYGQVIFAKITRSILLTFMTLMVAAYLMYTRDEIIEFFRSLVPARSRLSFDRLLFRIDRGFAGVVRGQLLIMLVNGILSALGFWLFGLKYWPILALLAGFMSIIPIFGSILSSIPAVMVGLTQDFWTALWVLLWIIGIHQVEANLLNPKIIGVAAKLHPVLVVFVLLVGEHYYGLWGALLAVPTLSLVQSFFNHFRYESLPDAPPDSVILAGVRSRIGSPD